jgi:hypothetical protein
LDMIRKRAPGGGRKPKGAAPMRSQVNVRMPDDIRAQLEAAARKRRRNVSEELLARLRVSFARERELDRKPATRALNYLISAIADLHAESAIRYGRLPKRPWTRDPFLFRSFKLTVARLLEVLEPPGDPQSFDNKHGDRTADLLPFDAPDDMADFASKELLWSLSVPHHVILRGDAKILDDEDKQELYALSNVRRDLGLGNDEPKSSEQGD